MKRTFIIFTTVLGFIGASNVFAETEYVEQVDPMTDVAIYLAVISGDKGNITFGCAPGKSTIITLTGLPYNPFEKKGTGRAFKVRFDKDEPTVISPRYEKGTFYIDAFFGETKYQADFLYNIQRRKKLIIAADNGYHTYNLVGANEIINKVLLKCNLAIVPPREKGDICKKNSKGEWVGPDSTIEQSNKELCELLNKPSAILKSE